MFPQLSSSTAVMVQPEPWAWNGSASGVAKPTQQRKQNPRAVEILAIHTFNRVHGSRCRAAVTYADGIGTKAQRTQAASACGALRPRHCRNTRAKEVPDKTVRFVAPSGDTLHV